MCWLNTALKQSLNNKMSQAKLWCIDENFPLHIKPPFFWTHNKCTQYCSNVYCIQDILSHWILIGVPMWRHRLMGDGGAVQGLAWNHVGLPWWLFGKESACNAGDLGSIPGSGRSPEGGNGNPFQYSCRENHMDRGASGLQSMGSQRLEHDWATKPSGEGLAWSHTDRKWKLGIWTQSHSNG